MYGIIARSCFLCLLIPSLSARDTGILTGRVSNDAGEPVAGVVLHIGEDGMRALTDSQGRYVLKGVAVGSVEVIAEHWAFEQKTVTTRIGIGINTLDIDMGSVVTTFELVVQGSIREGQAKALEEQKLAVNIKNIVASDQIGTFPDSNAAEATARVPGVNINRDQGEGRYVQIRGTEARLNKTTINGLALPAPEGDLRTVALDVIPLDILEAIAVTKAVTADMDGDAIGGSIDMRLKKAPYSRRMSIGLDYGYNTLGEEGFGGGDFYFGRRFFDDKLGISATYTIEDNERTTHNYEVSYDDGLPEELEQRDYQVSRERSGAHLALDYEPTERARYELVFSYSQFDDQEFRRRLTHVIPDGELERELKDRFESQFIRTLQLRGENFMGPGLFEWSLSTSFARESEPDRYDTTFIQEDVAFAPNFESGPFDGYNIQPNPTNQDFGQYLFDEVARENNYTSDEHHAIRLDYAWSSFLGDSTVTYKTGFKWRQKEKMQDVEVFELGLDEGDLFLTDFIDPDYNQTDFLEGQYQMGPFHGRRQVDQLRAMLDEVERDFEEDAADYEVTEDVTAAYFMATIQSGDWTLLPGLRYEQVSADYIGHEILFDDEGDFIADQEIRGDKDDDIFMPSFHATYRISQDDQLRGAMTRTYARASVYDQVPYQLILEEDREIERGNPEIEITESWNLDLSYERYFDDVGIFQAGFFYKDMTDYIYIFNVDEVIGGEEFEVITPLNGDDAQLWGFEVAYQKNFTSLPAPFNGLGLYLNYTWTDSEADLPERTITLPGQSDETGNLALIYEKGGFSMRLSGNLHGAYITEVGDEPEEDIYLDEQLQWDLSASYRMETWRVFLEVVNLNDEKYIFYEGGPRFPIQYEQYKTWGRLGVKIDF